MIEQFMSQPYWKLIVSFLVGIVYILFHNRFVVIAAKKRANIVILAAEKNASALSLTNEKQMMDWIMQMGYTQLPAVLRMFVSRITFNAIILDVYKTAADFVAKHKTQHQLGLPSLVPPFDSKASSTTANLPEARWPSIQSQ